MGEKCRHCQESALQHVAIFQSCGGWRNIVTDEQCKECGEFQGLVNMQRDLDNIVTKGTMHGGEDQAKYIWSAADG